MTDHRLLVVETELVSAFKVASRDGNTLSAVIRAAWDTGTLRTLTRNNPLTATNTHISIIGHITSEELRRHLDSTEAANGFGNRFLWLSVRRSKRLPDGGNLEPAALAPLVEQTRAALTFARRTGRVERSNAARELWHRVYDDLSEGQHGLVGSLLARAEAQVIRLSLLYALLDRAKQIEEPHLRAALELWAYADRSVRHLFGESTGTPTPTSSTATSPPTADSLEPRCPRSSGVTPQPTASTGRYSSSLATAPPHSNGNQPAVAQPNGLFRLVRLIRNRRTGQHHQVMPPTTV